MQNLCVFRVGCWDYGYITSSQPPRRLLGEFLGSTDQILHVSFPSSFWRCVKNDKKPTPFSTFIFTESLLLVLLIAASNGVSHIPLILSISLEFWSIVMKFHESSWAQFQKSYTLFWAIDASSSNTVAYVQFNVLSKEFSACTPYPPLVSDDSISERNTTDAAACTASNVEIEPWVQQEYCRDEGIAVSHLNRFL